MDMEEDSDSKHKAKCHESTKENNEEKISKQLKEEMRREK